MNTTVNITVFLVLTILQTLPNVVLSHYNLAGLVKSNLTELKSAENYEFREEKPLPEIFVI